MAATPIQESKRFYVRGTTKCLWVPTIANRAAPTRAELDAGTELGPEISAMAGWSTTSGTVPTPALGSRFTATVPGEITAPDSSLTFWASKDGEDVRTLLPRDATGFIVWMDGGDVPAQPMDVFPVQVTSCTKLRDMGNASQIQASFSITAEPEEDVAIPAATP